MTFFSCVVKIQTVVVMATFQRLNTEQMVFGSLCVAAFIYKSDNL